MIESKFGWDFPPGVTGSEPEITGDWPCSVCGFRKAACYCPKCTKCSEKPNDCLCVPPEEDFHGERYNNKHGE